MIEGLRLLPRFQEAARRKVLGPLEDCETCMQSYTRETRQTLGCGYEPPPVAGVAVTPWMGCGYSGDAPKACPGYTTKLPEVIEIARARMHWSKGSLATFLRGAEITDALERGIETLEGTSNETDHWRMTPASKGGGREEPQS